MANNYTQSSFAIPESWPEEAKSDFFDILTSLDNVCDLDDFNDNLIEFPKGYDDLADSLDFDNICLHGTTWKDPYMNTVGYYDMDSFDLENIEVIVRAIANKYHIPESEKCSISWAYICDKPRVGEFGGGEIEIWAK